MTKPFTLITVVTSRYDLLAQMLQSVRESCITHVLIIDNGRNADALAKATASTVCGVITPSKHLGLAEALNILIQSSSEERIYIADDIEIRDTTLLQRMIETPGDFVTALWFGCFIIRDSCIEKVGFFDEQISPGYLYFEDIDYAQRMMNANVPIVKVDGNLFHHRSATLKAIPEAELQTRHHDRFLIAQRNYIAKWGSLPDWIPQDL